MSAETLRLAAVAMRADWLGTTRQDFYDAVADSLDGVADDWHTMLASPVEMDRALAFARTYLGDVQ